MMKKSGLIRSLFVTKCAGAAVLVCLTASLGAQDSRVKVQVNLPSRQQAPARRATFKSSRDSQAQAIKTSGGDTKKSAKTETDDQPQQQAAIYNARPFEEGELFYNAIPSTPAEGNAIKVIDTKDDKDFICKIYKLKTNVGAEIKEFLKTAVLKENGQVDSTTNTLTGVNYLSVTAPIFQFPYVEELIKELDQPGTSWDNSGDPSTTYKMKHRLATEGQAFIIGAQKLSRDGCVYADDVINKLYICDVPTQLEDASTSIVDWDVPPDMVRIEARIIEIEMDDDFNFGLDWDAWKESLPESVSLSFDFEKTKNNAQAAAIGQPDKTARYVASALDLSNMRPKAVADMLNYLVRTGKANVLSRPTVVARNGQQATISSLDKISYTAFTNANTPMTQQSEVGVSLSIRPIIGSETVTLEISASVNSLMGFAGNGTPLINTRSTVANVVLKDKQLFTLSGLRKDVITKMNERIPFLGYIPLLGYLFRHEIDVKKTYEIVVVLRPVKVTPETGIMADEKKLMDDKTKEMEEKPSWIKQSFDRFILNE